MSGARPYKKHFKADAIDYELNKLSVQLRRMGVSIREKRKKWRELQKSDVKTPEMAKRQYLNTSESL